MTYEEYIASVVEQAPPLTDEQKSLIVRLFARPSDPAQSPAPVGPAVRPEPPASDSPNVAPPTFHAPVPELTEAGGGMSIPPIAELERRLRRGFASLSANLVDAYDNRDWEDMGYPSWEAYLAAEYGEFADFAAEIVRRWRP